MKLETKLSDFWCVTLLFRRELNYLVDWRRKKQNQEKNTTQTPPPNETDVPMRTGGPYVWKFSRLKSGCKWSLEHDGLVAAHEIRSAFKTILWKILWETFLRLWIILSATQADESKCLL